MTFIAPLLLSILVAQHATNWLSQSSVSGYFVRTYRQYGAEPLSLYISWLNPLTLVIAALCFCALVFLQRTWPRIRSFCRWPTGVLGVAVIVVGVASVAWLVVQFRGLVPASKPEVAVGLLLAIAFKVLAVLVIWKALKASGTSIADSSGEGAHKPSWKLLVVLACSIHLLLPVRHYVVSIAGMLIPDAIPSWLWPHNLRIQTFFIDVVLALLMARLLVVRGGREGVFALQPGSRAVSIGFWFAVAFVLLTPVAVLLGAIPYGGSGVPKEVKSLLAVTEGIGTYLLYRGLVQPPAQRSSSAG